MSTQLQSKYRHLLTQIVVGSSRKKRRALQLLKDYLEADGLDAATLTRILHRAEAAIDFAEEEEAKAENEARGSKKRKIGGGNTRNSSSSPAKVTQQDSSSPIQTHSTIATDRQRSISIDRFLPPPDLFSDAGRLSQLKEGSAPV